jgi:multiple antibiotic resistance protein
MQRMEDLAGHAATVFMGFFAVMNPIANTPVFLGLTADDAEADRRKVALRAVVATFFIILVFILAGKLIFALFGITLPAFRLAGGILLFMIGYHMLQGEPSRMHNPSESDARKSLEAELGVAISPLAVPILAGPGTIATAVNFAAPGGIMDFVVTIAAFFALCLITLAFFVSGERFVRYLGDNGIKVVTRLMGLILAVIGTQMFIEGAKGAFEHITS